MPSFISIRAACSLSLRAHWHQNKRRRLTTEAVATPPYRVLLFGADHFSCATLQALHEAGSGLISELTVVTPPDAKTGRGLKTIHTPPLRTLAEELKIRSIALPKTLLSDWRPPEPFTTRSRSNLLLTASFGHLIPSRLLELFHPLNALNVHPSLLPKYRGAAPIQWAIANGETSSGVSVQELSRGKFDQGRLLGQKELSIPNESTFESVEPIMAREGANLLIEILRNLPQAQAQAVAQDSSAATLAPKLTKNFAKINWREQSAIQLIRLQRAIAHQLPLRTTFQPNSGQEEIELQLKFATTPIPIHDAPSALRDATPGTAIFLTPMRQLLVKCADSGAILEIEKVKSLGGKGWIPAKEWFNGLKSKGESQILFQ